jgi:hypothetical protein
MTSAIFSQIKGLIGRTLILAGLLPSAVVIFGLYVYLHGLKGVSLLVNNFTAESGALSTETNILLIIWLIIGVLFVTFRLAIMNFIVDLPGTLLTPLRYFLESRMLERREQLFRNKGKTLFACTALDWHLNNYSQPKFLPPFIHTPNSVLALNNAGRARRVVEYLMDPRYNKLHIPTLWQLKAIQKGLSDLYSYGTIQENDTNYANEVSEWRALTQDDIAKNILKQVSDYLRRSHASTLKKYSAYPKGKWIKPTIIGNLMSSLDDYSEDRYEIDTATIWSRLWWIISDGERKEVMHAKFQIELLLNHMAAFILLSLFIVINSLLSVFGFSLITTDLSAWEIIIYLIILLMLSITTYRGSAFAFLAFKEKTTSLIDLNRHMLLRKLGYTPKNVKDEMELLNELHNFIVQAEPRDQQRKIEFS